MFPRTPRRAKGFTILELMLASAVAVVIVGGVYMVYDASQSTARKDERKSDLQQNARNALDMLFSQLRLAGYYQDPSPDISFSSKPNRIIIGTDNVLVVRGDVQLTGIPGFVDTLLAVQPTANAICTAPPCLMVGTNVYTVSAAQTVAAYNISAVSFAYFDNNNVQLATPLDGVGPGAFPNGTVPSPLPSPLPAPNAPDPLTGTASRNAVTNVLVTVTAIACIVWDPATGSCSQWAVSAGPGVGSTSDRVTLSAFVRLRNAN